MTRLLILAALVLAPTVSANAQESTVDSLMAAFDRDDGPGGVVAVIRGGSVVFVKAYGMADLTFNVPNGRETLFNIGSVSKQFAGIFFAMLAEQGRVNLDDDVRTYAPELPDFGQTVTLRHLLNHTSGYREVYGVLGMQGRLIDEDLLKREDALDVVRHQTALQFPPGSRRLYNSSAYVILTTIAERITGLSYPDWMQDNVFVPLGMQHTTIEREPGEVITGSATSYVTTASGSYRDEYDSRAYYGATDIYTTVDDLARWIRNFRSNELGGPGVMRRMLERSISTYGDTLNYTFGLVLDQHLGLDRIQHSGSTGGYRAFLGYYPDLDAAVVVLSNTGAVPVTRVASHTAAAFFGNEARAQPEIADESIRGVNVASRLLDHYAGSYWEPGEGVLALERRGQSLAVSEPVEEAAPLLAVDDSTFQLEDGILLRFYPASDGVVLQDMGRGGTRLTRVMPIPESYDLSVYAGRYFSKEIETFYQIIVEDGVLAVVHRRLGTVPLTPLAHDIFGGPWPLSELVFERKAGGGITGFSVTEGRTIGVPFRLVE